MISETVMKANSAITFEAAELSPADTHSEVTIVVKATIPADVSAEDAVKLLEPVISHITGSESKDAHPQVTD